MLAGRGAGGSGFNLSPFLKKAAEPATVGGMTKWFFVLLWWFCVPALRADLVMEQEYSTTNVIGHSVLKVHDDQMRMDTWDDFHSNAFSVIIDLKTLDSYTLMPTTKTYRQRLGAVTRRLTESRDANDEMNRQPAKPVDTGKGEKVGGYDTEVYTWSGARGRSETLWVATNYPNFEAIRKDLARVDEFDDIGPHRNYQPQVSGLPGVVVKAQVTTSGKEPTLITLVSAKVEPLDRSVFDLPADYAPWHPKEISTNNAATSPGK